MVAGSFKDKIGLGDRCMLSVPTVLTGKGYQIRSRSVYVQVELPVLYEHEPIWIALDIRQQEDAPTGTAITLTEARRGLLGNFHRLDHHELPHRTLIQELDATSNLRK
jgi:hypothetical protein